MTQDDDLPLPDVVWDNTPYEAAKPRHKVEAKAKPTPLAQVLDDGRVYIPNPTYAKAYNAAVARGDNKRAEELLTKYGRKPQAIKTIRQQKNEKALEVLNRVVNGNELKRRV